MYPRIGLLAVAAALEKILSFMFKFFYVMGKVLSGKLYVYMDGSSLRCSFFLW